VVTTAVVVDSWLLFYFLLCQESDPMLIVCSVWPVPISPMFPTTLGGSRLNALFGLDGL